MLAGGVLAGELVAGVVVLVLRSLHAPTEMATHNIADTETKVGIVRTTFRFWFIVVSPLSDGDFTRKDWVWLAATMPQA